MRSGTLVGARTWPGWCALFALLLAAPASAQGPAPVESERKPHPIVFTPLVTPADRVDLGGPPFLGVVSFHVGVDGFVREARFDGAAPPNADAILARARRWIFDPARDAWGRPRDAWTSMRVKASVDALLVDRPDSTMGAVLGAANYANVKLFGRGDKGVQRDLDPVKFAHVFADWISEPKAYEGDDPWRAHCPASIDARIEFDGPGGTLHADFARACAFMQVSTRDRVLFVPYGKIRARIDEAFAKLFPDSAAKGR